MLWVVKGAMSAVLLPVEMVRDEQALRTNTKPHRQERLQESTLLHVYNHRVTK